MSFEEFTIIGQLRWVNWLKKQTRRQQREGKKLKIILGQKVRSRGVAGRTIMKSFCITQKYLDFIFKTIEHWEDSSRSVA